MIPDLAMPCMHSCHVRGLLEHVALHLGSRADEIRIKEDTTAMLRCIPFEQLL